MIQRNKINLDITWPKDDSLEDFDNLPDSDVLASEIIVNLETALNSFGTAMETLNEDLQKITKTE